VFWCVVFGAGNWSIPTEQRGPAPTLVVGQVIWLGGGASGQCPAKVTAVDPRSPRLVELTFADAGAALWEFLYTQGRPVQYAYLDRGYPLAQFQTAYAGRPWAAEMPSAGRGLSWEVLQRLAAAGIEIATLTHAAGLSSTGDAELDARLPLPERYEIPEATVEAIAVARASGRRVIAVGTTVVRALEGAAVQGALHAGPGLTDFKLGPTTELQIVDSLLTGMHGPGESHFELLSAFAERARLLTVWEQAAAHGFICHEFGDLCLILEVPTGPQRS
ncbi:MAG: S-adenosylmethionine:tRNA ribosyltransferase-isomerase, partial [Nannocystaceae bacterium]